MKKWIALVTVLTVLLCGCGGGEPETTAPTQIPETTAPAQTTEAPVETTEVPTETTVPPTEAPPVDVNPLTGEELEEVNNNRVVAVMINNHSAALPHCGIGSADIIYEILAEGSTTRLMALFTDLTDVGPIGPVRSLRPYYLNIMRGYGAMCTSAGGSSEADGMIYNLGYDRVNGIAGIGSGYFYRDSWRSSNKGYEHSLFITGPKLLEAAAAEGYSTVETEGREYGLTFTEDEFTAGEDINKIVVHFYANGKTTILGYKEDLGGYLAYQQKAYLLDGNTDENILFENVLVLKTSSAVIDGKGHLRVETTGEGKGWYARDGKLIEIKWSRDNEESPFTYTDLDGNPITFGVGKSYITFIPSDSPVDFMNE